MKYILPLKSMLLLSSLLILWYSCKHDPVEVEEIDTPTTCDTTLVSFTEDIEEILETKCNNTNACHVSGGGGLGNFESYSGLKEKADSGSLRTRVLVQMTMPPAGSPQLNDCEINLIESWLNQGAQNN